MYVSLSTTELRNVATASVIAAPSAGIELAGATGIPSPVARVMWPSRVSLDSGVPVVGAPGVGIRRRVHDSARRGRSRRGAARTPKPAQQEESYPADRRLSRARHRVVAGGGPFYPAPASFEGRPTMADGPRMTQVRGR